MASDAPLIGINAPLKTHCLALDNGHVALPYNLQNLSKVNIRIELTMIQWNLVITRSLGSWDHENCLVISGFSLYQGKKNKYKEQGPAKLPCYKRILLYPTSL